MRTDFCIEKSVSLLIRVSTTLAGHSFESTDAICDIFNFSAKDVVSLSVARSNHLIRSVILVLSPECFFSSLCLLCFMLFVHLLEFSLLPSMGRGMSSMSVARWVKLLAAVSPSSECLYEGEADVVYLQVTLCDSHLSA